MSLLWEERFAMAMVAFVLRESNATMRNATRKNVVMEEGKVD